VEGVHVKQGAVIGANVSLTKSTKIIDVTQNEPVEYKGVVPENSVVIPGTCSKEFAAGTFQIDCALIIGKRNVNTDMKTSLNEVLRDYQL
jgi:2,3,4,5-tetrahydropyridine-2-carboxylate N-succinyltransferase